VRPLLLVDIDGVISLFGFPGPALPAWRSEDPAGSPARPEGVFHTIDGIPHYLSTAAARHLLDLVSVFELVWCSGWEEKADEYLPHLLGLPRGLPFLSFEREMRAMGGADASGAGDTRAHWKLNAIDAYAGDDRSLAWIDDAFNDACHEWAGARGAPTLLVQTDPPTGLTEREAVRLREWALAAAPA
jgi:HAD domain in Swiss Army Knife RNA repair proteins